jgi:hypothetical protein
VLVAPGRMLMVMRVMMPVIVGMMSIAIVRRLVLDRTGYGRSLMQLAVDHDVNLCRLNAAPAYPGDAQLRPQRQRSRGLLQPIEGCACVHQRAHQHVAADPGKTFQVCNPHKPHSRVPELTPGLAKPVSTSMGNTSFMDPERYPSQSRET